MVVVAVDLLLAIAADHVHMSAADGRPGHLVLGNGKGARATQRPGLAETGALE